MRPSYVLLSLTPVHHGDRHLLLCLEAWLRRRTCRVCGRPRGMCLAILIVEPRHKLVLRTQDTRLNSPALGAISRVQVPNFKVSPGAYTTFMEKSLPRIVAEYQVCRFFQIELVIVYHYFSLWKDESTLILCESLNQKDHCMLRALRLHT